jgi:glycogen synthase
MCGYLLYHMVANLKKRSIINMVLLTAVTLGFYYPFYFLSLEKELGLPKTKEKMTEKLIYVLFGIVLIKLLAIVAPVYSLISQSYADTLEYLFLTVVLILCFHFKNILAVKLHKKKFSSTATFLFTIFYLQYKVNGDKWV